MATVLEFNAALLPRGPFDPSASYETLNFVESGGSGYVCLQPCSGIPVTNTAYWFKFVHKGDPGTPFTYADLTPEQKAELAHDATIAAQAAQAAAEQAAQKFAAIKDAIDALDPSQSTSDAIVAEAAARAAKDAELEAGLGQLGPKIDEQINPFAEVPSDTITNRVGNVFKATATSAYVTNGHWYLYCSSSNSSMTGKSNSCKYILITVRVGDKYTIAPTNGVSPHAPRAIFLTEVPEFKTNTYTDITDKIIDSILSISEKTTLTVPANAVCMYVEQEYAAYGDSSATNIAPTCTWQDSEYNLHEDVEAIKVQIVKDDVPTEGSNNNVTSGGLFNELYVGEDAVEIDITQYEAVRAFPNPTIWITNNNTYPYYGKFIPITGGQKYRITGNADGATFYGFLTTNTYSANASVSYASGCTRVTVAKGSILIDKAPADAKYLYVATYTTADRTPQKIENYYKDSLSEKIDTLQGEIGEKGFTYVEVAMPHYSGKRLYKGDSATVRDGKWYIATNSSYALIPVNGGDAFKIIAGNAMCIYAFLIDNANGEATVISGTSFYAANYADGESMQTISANMTKVIVAPSDAKYLYVFQGNDVNRTSIPSFVGIRRSWEDSINKGVGTDILDFHPEVEMLAMIKTMAFKGKTDVRSNVWGCFVFGHITDCHGRDNETYSKWSWGRFVRFCRYYKAKNERFIADMVDTGDIVADSAAVGGTAVSANWRADADDVLITLGNHDVANKATSSSSLAYTRIGLPAYNQFLADKIDGWNVVQPTDAATNGYCYFYKDYEIGGGETSSTTPAPHGLRAIFIDAMDWLVNGSASLDYHQAAFVKSALDGALEEGRHVVIFSHEWPGSMVNFDCTWNESPYQTYNQDIADSNSKVANDSTYNYLAYLVAKFQEDGGGFAGYVCGHHHTGFIGRKTGTCTFDDETIDFDNGTPQLVICGHYGRVSNNAFPASGGGNLSWTGINTINQDCFRIISIDTTNNIVKLMQIGKELDYALKAKGLLSIRYNTYQPFDETVTTYARNSIVAKDGFLWRILTPAYKDVEVEGVTQTHTDWDNTIKVMYNRVFNR